MILRKIAQYVFFLSIICSFVSVVVSSPNPEQVSPKVAVFLSFSHSLLEDCSQSCIEVLSTMENAPEVLVVNAEDSVVKARKLARTLHADQDIVAIVTLGSIATKIMSQIETKKPIIYAVVPEGETLAFPKNQTNIYGVNDTLDINQCCFAIQAVRTNAESLIYIRPSEPFPSALQKEIEKKLHASGIAVTDILVTQANFKTRLQQAIEKRPSAIFIPFSSLPQKQGTAFIEEILKEKIPVITDDLSLVAEGACVACGVDFKKSGKQAAQMVYHLLNRHQDIEGLRKIIAEPLPQTTTFNEDVIRRLGLKINRAERKQFRSIIFKDNKDKKAAVKIDKSETEKNTSPA
ncbi:ABC transporter substrate-binding protein [Chlamydia vaughanii]|uniref:ABC transporter substrate-binding protein n=1 Tax=Chlamydia vaughanii TaxID=3112552 RepID=UPI0032B10B68